MRLRIPQNMNHFYYINCEDKLVDSLIHLGFLKIVSLRVEFRPLWNIYGGDVYKSSSILSVFNYFSKKAFS